MSFSHIASCLGLAPVGNKEPRGCSFTPPLSLGWGEKSEGKDKSSGLGQNPFNQTVKGEESNKNTDRNNTQNEIFALPDAQLASK